MTHDLQIDRDAIDDERADYRDNADLGYASPAKCPWCRGHGWEAVEAGSTLRYACPDCGGTGLVHEVEP